MDGRIIFSEHARQQMKIRSITQTAVRAAIRYPDKLDTQSDRRIRVAEQQGRMVLVVIYERQKDGLVVVTAFQSSKQGKYLS